jgi:putative SOS response-associated peptidase YedK
MFSHYEAVSPAALGEAFGVEPYEQLKLNLWSGSFGLIPGWSKDDKIARRTYNARSETVASKPSFRNAWRHGQHCIIPAAAVYEPDWRSGKAVPTRIERVDGELMGIAGLWERWKNAHGEIVFSYTMLTVNADDHTFMRDYHQVDHEKRMVVVLPQRGLSRLAESRTW